LKQAIRKRKQEDARESKGETDEMQKQLDGVFCKYRGERPEVIPILQDVQSVLGYLPPAAIAAVAKFLRAPESVVFGVVTFYAQFHLARQGKHKIRVCQGTACHVRGGKQILDTVRKRLGIRAGQTTADYQYSLERVACFGSCALGPVVVVNDKVHGRMTPQKTEKLLETLK
jgi:NADH-quinone oxidoreductase subunit E